MENLPFWTGFYTSQVVQDFVQQQYHVLLVKLTWLFGLEILQISTKKMMDPFIHGPIFSTFGLLEDNMGVSQVDFLRLMGG